MCAPTPPTPYPTRWVSMTIGADSPFYQPVELLFPAWADEVWE
jgi:hypothetical protein